MVAKVKEEVLRLKLYTTVLPSLENNNEAQWCDYSEDNSSRSMRTICSFTAEFEMLITRRRAKGSKIPKLSSPNTPERRRTECPLMHKSTSAASPSDDARRDRSCEDRIE